MSTAPQLDSTRSAATIAVLVKPGEASIASRALQLLFGSVVGANVLSMSLMNFFESPSSSTAFVYAGCMTALLLLMTRHLPQLPALTRKQHLLCLGLGFVVFLPRLGYLIE